MARSQMRFVGSMLVRNEDVFIERALRNVVGVFDTIHVCDHMSTDRTWEILQSLAREYDHVDLFRSKRTRDSHRPLEQYAGTRTWVLGVDGDELYDPSALERLRAALDADEHSDVFRLKGHVLNCDDLDVSRRRAVGWMAPPSRPVTKLFNFAALESWSGSSQRLHDGQPVFRPGFGMASMRYLSDTTGWDDDLLRCVHACFVTRSTRDRANGRPRLNVNETREHDRTLLGRTKRLLRGNAPPQDVAALHRAGTSWKRDWYARGERQAVDATPFLGAA